MGSCCARRSTPLLERRFERQAAESSPELRPADLNFETEETVKLESDFDLIEMPPGTRPAVTFRSFDSVDENDSVTEDSWDTPDTLNTRRGWVCQWKRIVIAAMKLKLKRKLWNLLGLHLRTMDLQLQNSGSGMKKKDIQALKSPHRRKLDAAWSQLGNELKAIKNQTGDCSQQTYAPTRAPRQDPGDPLWPDNPYGESSITLSRDAAVSRYDMARMRTSTARALALEPRMTQRESQRMRPLPPLAPPGTEPENEAS